MEKLPETQSILSQAKVPGRKRLIFCIVGGRAVLQRLELKFIWLIIWLFPWSVHVVTSDNFTKFIRIPWEILWSNVENTWNQSYKLSHLLSIGQINPAKRKFGKIRAMAIIIALFSTSNNVDDMNPVFEFIRVSYIIPFDFYHYISFYLPIVIPEIEESSTRKNASTGDPICGVSNTTNKIINARMAWPMTTPNCGMKCDSIISDVVTPATRLRCNIPSFFSII